LLIGFHLVGAAVPAPAAAVCAAFSPFARVASNSISMLSRSSSSSSIERSPPPPKLPLFALSIRQDRWNPSPGHHLSVGLAHLVFRAASSLNRSRHWLKAPRYPNAYPSRSVKKGVLPERREPVSDTWRQHPCNCAHVDTGARKQNARRVAYTARLGARLRECAYLDLESHGREGDLRGSRERQRRRELTQASHDRMLIFDSSVRWTGHFPAISSNFDRCSLESGPASWSSRSMRSRTPSFVSHSEQSSA
jgi:hypothetical protein